MGRTTKNYRQSNRSISGNDGAKNYSQIIRQDGWHIKLINYLKVRGKNNG